ncbi:MAG: hypothetical protein KDA85_18640 [Planctomycetaceae bacterium]|nr:hypothetical protein [Planctomycetaceae bacterium]
MIHVQSSGQQERRGSAAVIVIILLVLMTVLLSSQLLRVLREQRQVQTDVLAIQAELISDAAIQRATQQLVRNPEYRNETWHIPAGMVHASHEAEVQIDVSADKTCTVITQYPVNRAAKVRITRTQRLVP